MRGTSLRCDYVKAHQSFCNEHAKTYMSRNEGGNQAVSHLCTMNFQAYILMIINFILALEFKNLNCLARATLTILGKDLYFVQNQPSEYPSQSQNT